jgi:hypothetical protein
VKTPIDARLRDEASRFQLRYRCDDCVHFDAARERCTHGYPTAPHRVGLDGEVLVFCKEFDAGP